MKNKPLVFLTALVAAAATTAFAEQPTGLYFGPEIGSADLQEDGFGFNTDETFWGLAVGWQATQHVGVELGYIDVKDIKDSLTDGSDTLDGSLALSAITGSVIGAIPMGDRWSLFGRAGAANLRAKVSGRLNGTPIGSVSEDSTEFFWGAGIGMMAEGARLRLEYRRIEFEAGDAGLISLGLMWFLPWGR